VPIPAITWSCLKASSVPRSPTSPPFAVPRLSIRKGFPALLPAGSDSYTSFPALPGVVRDASGALDTGLGT